VRRWRSGKTEIHQNAGESTGHGMGLCLIFNFQQPLTRRRIELMLEKTKPLRKGRKSAEGDKRQILLTMDPELITAIKNDSPRRPKPQGNGLNGANRN
jgi:hypothetical protein